MLMRLPLVCFLLASVGVCSPQGLGGTPFDVRESFVLAGEKAIGMLAPEPASGSNANAIQWSTSGNYLLVQRTDFGSATVLRSLV